MKLRRIVASICAVVFVCLFANLGIGQTDTTSCDLAIRVYENKLDGKPGDTARIVVMDETTQLRNATATAKKNGSNRFIRSVNRSEMPVFAGLAEGRYEVTVSKQGYRRMTQGITVDCSWANRENVLYENINLNFGDVLETPERAPEKFTVRGDRSFENSDEPGVSVTVGLSEKANSEAARPVPPRPRPIPRQISGGVLNGKAVSLPLPPYPPAARAVKAGGAVSVQVLIDEEGNVISASPVSGHPLLRAAAGQAALGAKFSPTLLEGHPVKVSGVITYNFTP